MTRADHSTPRAPWTANATPAQIADRLRSARSVVTLTHAKADGDAVGSTIALARTLAHLGARVACVYPTPWFATFDAFIGDTPVLRLPESAPAAAFDRLGFEPDLVAIVDTGSWAQLADARPWLEPRSAKAVVIDHHPSGNAEIAPLRWVQTSAAAACEMVAQLSATLLGVDVRSLPSDIAEPLYLGVATDTGFFRFSNTTPATLRLAADLIDAGADASRVYQISEQSDRPARLRIIARALARLEMHADDRIALLPIAREDFLAAGADLEDAGGLSDFPLAVASVRVAAILTELDAGVTKVSLRSKPPTRDNPSAVDVNAVAESLGGGGHVRAAGVKIKAPLEDARRRVLAALTSALP